MNNSRNIAEKGQKNVDPELDSESYLQKDADRGKQDRQNNT